MSKSASHVFAGLTTLLAIPVIFGAYVFMPSQLGTRHFDDRFYLGAIHSAIGFLALGIVYWVSLHQNNCVKQLVDTKLIANVIIPVLAGVAFFGLIGTASTLVARLIRAVFG